MSLQAGIRSSVECRASCSGGEDWKGGGGGRAIVKKAPAMRTGGPAVSVQQSALEVGTGPALNVEEEWWCMLLHTSAGRGLFPALAVWGRN